VERRRPQAPPPALVEGFFQQSRVSASSSGWFHILNTSSWKMKLFFHPYWN
jgi:hypothetical protein